MNHNINTMMDLDEIILKCRDKNSREYVREAVDCYKVGAYRACVVSTWIALVYDIVSKLRELALTGDVEAKKQVTLFDQIQHARDIEAALKFERDVLILIRDAFEFITAQEFEDLKRLSDDRNRCSHPNLNRDDQAYVPSPELARLHLRNSVEHVISRPPVQGKAALEHFHNIISSEYFPDQAGDAEIVLKAQGLERVKTRLIKDLLLGCLTSILREDLTKFKAFQRISAAQSIIKLHPQDSQKILVEHFDKIISSTGDDDLGKAVALLRQLPDQQSILVDATWVKLNNYISKLGIKKIGSVNSSILIPNLRDATVSRISTMNTDDLIAYTSRLTGSVDKIILDKMVSLYSHSNSYEMANTVARKILSSCIDQFDSEQVDQLITAGHNSQVGESTAYPSLVEDLLAKNIITSQRLVELARDYHLEEVLQRVLPQTKNESEDQIPIDGNQI